LTPDLPLRAAARPRIGLLGNPSDVCAGAGLSLTFDDFEASACLAPRAAGWRLRGPATELETDSLRALLEDEAGGHDLSGGLELLAAACIRFADWYLDGELPPLELSFASNIPRQVGLAGSSAIIMATLRALATHAGVAHDPFRLSELALSAETELLGIGAGPQDRVAQAYEGLMRMDFTPPHDPGKYQRLSTSLLPASLFMAWDPAPGDSSGVVHGSLRERYCAGESSVLEVRDALRTLTFEGADALARGDRGAFARAVDENFDLRTRLVEVRPRDRAMVELGRAHGAAVKFCGSGGAIVGLPADDADLPALEEAYLDAGLRWLLPTPTPTPLEA